MGVHGSCTEIEPIPCTQRTLQATEPLCPSHPLQLIISGTSLAQMPLLNCQFLKSYRERRLAHLVLSLITMGYVWQEGEAQPAEVRGKLFPVCSWAGLLPLGHAICLVPQCFSGKWVLSSSFLWVSIEKRTHLNEKEPI